MKLKSNQLYSYMLIELSFLKLSNTKLSIYRKLFLRSILNLLFYYHILDRRILFIANFSDFFYNRLLNLFVKTKHLFLPTKFWVSGLFINKTFMFKYYKMRLQTMRLLTKTFSNLAVAIVPKNFNSPLKEIQSLKVPLITINWDDHCRIPVSFNSKFLDLLFLLICSTLNKSK